ncbi:MAG: thioredoxin-like protein [Monoraphidium minutum]|nr:MAG: thioredoxin-like protein [Monoraphidium minutum]
MLASHSHRAVGCGRTAAPRALGAAAPRPAQPRCVGGAARAVSAEQQAREDALKQLESFASANKENLATATEERLRKATAPPPAPAGAKGGLRELTSADFWTFLEGSADKLTVVDFFTDWCGPCKLIMPELVKMHEELTPRGGQVVKLNCNKENKDLGKELAIKVAPTFHLYRGREKVGEMTGAKVDKLRELIEANL